MALRNKVFFWLIVIFAVLNIVDGITALKILPGESNPIYLLTGSLVMVYVLKASLVLGMIYFYKRKSFPTHFTYFFFIMIMVYGNVLLLTGIAANSYGISNPDYVEQVEDIPQEEKLAEYGFLISFLYLLPMGLSLLGFKLYEWSINCIDIIKPEKKKPWWKFW